MITKVYSQDLSAKNTFGMKVSCRVWMEYDSVADLFDMDFEQMHKPVKHIGAGSNLLFTQDFKGTILHSKINFIEVLSSMKDPSDPEAVFVSVGAGVVFDDFCAWAASKGLWGVENLSHIPGEVGASAVQNIGAYGVEACDVIKTVYAYDIEEEDFVRFDVSECGYGYRESMFKKSQNAGRYIITHVLFRLTKAYSPRLDYGHVKDALPAGAPVTPALVRDSIVAIRKNKLPEPERLGSAGSFFKNPVVQRSVYEAIASKSP
ncbi:MAG: FAD-binding protein, partial [Bacteroidales bacterium]|nr:FAD-binding protein [Bacteroidales bacterium]